MPVVERLNLKANSRTVLGKQVKKLRQVGNLPANIFGKGVSSTAVTIAGKEFKSVLHQAGETGLIYVTIDGEDQDRPVLVHDVQRHPVTSLLLHVDFYQVNLKERTSANVPIVLVGENELEKRGDAMILQTLNEVEVEALPTDIPHEFSIDVTKLTEIGQAVKVGDLEYDREKVEIQTDSEESILIMQSAEMEEEPIEEEQPAEVEVITEKKEEGEATEEETPA